MTKKDFFIAAIRVFGMFSLVTSVFSAIPTSISYALMDVDAISILWMMLTATAVGGLFVLLVFRADRVVRDLRLDKGFDDDRIDLGNLKSADLIKIGTFIISGLMILQNIPAFISHALFAYKSSNMRIPYGAEDKFRWAVSAINLVVGYLLLVHYEVAAKIMKAKLEKESAEIR